MKILVFYAGLLYEEFAYKEGFRHLQTTCNPEIYNGAYAYIPAANTASHEHARCWYRMDGTPVLIADVPKELLLLMLLIT